MSHQAGLVTHHHHRVATVHLRPHKAFRFNLVHPVPWPNQIHYPSSISFLLMRYSIIMITNKYRRLKILKTPLIKNLVIQILNLLEDRRPSHQVLRVRSNIYPSTFKSPISDQPQRTITLYLRTQSQMRLFHVKGQHTPEAFRNVSTIYHRRMAEKSTLLRDGKVIRSSGLALAVRSCQVFLSKYHGIQLGRLRQ